jgi:hypothetical protein
MTSFGIEDLYNICLDWRWDCKHYRTRRYMGIAVIKRTYLLFFSGACSTQFSTLVFFKLRIVISPWMDGHRIRRICVSSLTSLSSFWSALSLKLVLIIHLVGCLISGLILHMIIEIPRQLHCQTSRVRASDVCYHLQEHCHPSVAQSDTTF